MPFWWRRRKKVLATLQPVPQNVELAAATEENLDTAEELEKLFSEKEGVVEER